MMKYDKIKLVEKEINPLMDKIYAICESHGLPFFSFVMAAADEEERSVDWVSTRTVPETIKPGDPLPDSLWHLLNLSSAIIKDAEKIK